MSRNVKIARIVALLATLVSIFVATRLQLSKDLTTLFPNTPEAAALARVSRAFGGGDVALVLVRADDPELVTRAAMTVAAELRTCSSVRSVMTAANTPSAMDPTEAWRFAGPAARDRLARAVTEEGMRERLRETRALLLAPGAGDAAEMIERDPLRLAMIPWQDRIEVAAGAKALDGQGDFVTSDGRARLVVIEPRGRAFESGEALRFTTEAERAIARARTTLESTSTSTSTLRIDLTGGHVVAQQTEAMMKSDLQKSGALSFVLASVVFVVTFRRVRALLAVLPPLLAGTLWTTALAATIYPHISAIATAFAAVVIGVGVDTGVHVYGRLLHARREGLTPSAAADVARRETWKPTLSAAVAAGGAFGCLLLSDIEGMRQLGVLCAAGEILTAVAILIVVPEVGALLERGPPPSSPAEAWRWIAELTRTKTRAIVALAAVALAVAAASSAGLPKIDHAVIALEARGGKERALPALATYDEIYETFGSAKGQLMVVSADADDARARARADAVAEAADRLLAGETILGYDALARLAPSPELQRMRLAERDRLDLPSRRAMLSKALVDEGFAIEGFAPALEAFAHPSTNTTDVLTADNEWLRRRYLARDARGAIAVTYVRLGGAKATSGSEENARVLLRAADPGAVLTSFPDLEKGLVRTLSADLPRVLLAALAVIVVMLMLTLRRASRVVLAVGVLFVEIAIVIALSRVLHIRWHVYDALVLPVLLGITLDEVLFLLAAAERTAQGTKDDTIVSAILEQAPLGTTTALTTAAGFGALIVCRFEGLVDVGKVGALGSTVGLVVALLVIPAVVRLLRGAAA